MEEYIIFYKNMACMCSRNAHATGIGTCITIGTCSIHLHMQSLMAYAPCNYSAYAPQTAHAVMPGMSTKFAYLKHLQLIELHFGIAYMIRI